MIDKNKILIKKLFESCFNLSCEVHHIDYVYEILLDDEVRVNLMSNHSLKYEFYKNDEIIYEFDYDLNGPFTDYVESLISKVVPHLHVSVILNHGKKIYG